MAKNKIRVRYAPSPTGHLHIGNARTALFNYLFARHNKGTFVIRIEDTDTKRNIADGENSQLDNLKWLGMDWDEGPDKPGDFGPYRQSERREIYTPLIEELVAKGLAYESYKTEDELTEEREAQKAAGEAPRYIYEYEGMSDDEIKASQEAAKAKGLQPVVRLRLPKDHVYKFDDIVKGEISFESDRLGGDFVIMKRDGMPTYNFAVVVDDHLMEITHVIRGEEWLPSAPLHVLLYKAFGWEDTMPCFAHLPLLLKPDGKGKLSKRDGDRLGFPVFPLEWQDPKTEEISNGFREQGYFPEAVINFLALLGWNPGTEQELFTLNELVEQFDIAKCSKAGAKFDFQKGIWFNHEYMLKKSDEEIASLFAPIVAGNGVEETLERVTQVVHMMKDRVNFVQELWPLCEFFFIAPTEYDEKTVKKRWKEDSAKVMGELAEVLEGIDDFSLENQEHIVLGWVEKKGYKLGDVMNAFRLTLVGIGKGPGMFDISAFLGKEETLRRLHKAIEVLK